MTYFLHGYMVKNNLIYFSKILTKPKTQQIQPFIWLRYIDDIFFIWIHGEKQLNLFFEDLN